MVIATQAWKVGNFYWDAFSGVRFPVTILWFVERGLVTTLAFYLPLAVFRLLQRQRAWFVGVLALTAVGLCYTLLRHTLWGLPVFVAIHLGALLFITIRYVASQFAHPHNAWKQCANLRGSDPAD
jgi:hypothetical protein